MVWVRTAPGTEGMANILASHSLNAAALDAHVALYRTIMFGDSPLSRAEREAIAVAVSAANDCFY
jgi:alkylhydroperoxidase family enzyme